MMPLAMLMRTVVPLTVSILPMVPALWSRRAFCVAFVRPATSPVACTHLMELGALCLLLIPIGIRASPM